MAEAVSADAPPVLKLVGYQTLSDGGFALPCYGVAPRPNQWWLARSLIPGDHQSVVASFEPFDPAEVCHLASPDPIAVAVGAPWHDVFLHDGQTYVGPPREILAELAGRFETVAAVSPFDALELALAAGYSGAPELMRSARAAIADLYGEARAEHWLTQLVIRPQARMELRRRLYRAGLADDRHRVQQIQVGPALNGYRLTAPARLVEAFARAGQEEALAEAATAVASILAVPIASARSRGGDVLRNIRVTGTAARETEAIIAASGLRLGAPISDDLLEQGLERVRSLDRFGQVTGHHQNGEATLHVEELSLILAVRVEGAYRLPSEKVQAAAALKPATRYSKSAVSQALARIHELYFDHEVAAEYETRTDWIEGGVVVTFQIEEDAPPEFTGHDVLVIHQGRDAAAVVRQLSSPDWSPFPGRIFLPDARHGPRFSLSSSAISRIVLSKGLPRGRLDDFGVVVFLVDDNPAELKPLLSGAYEYLFAGAVRHRVMIAPVPRSDGPSDILLSRSAAGAPLDALMLDTSTARSPLWPGRSKTGWTARVAECVIGGAMMLAAGIASDRRRADLDDPLPVFAWARENRFGRLALASETFPDRLNRVGRDDKDVFGFEVFAVDGSGPAEHGYGVVSTRPPEIERFDDLAEMAFQIAGSREAPPPRGLREREDPVPWIEGLEASALAVMLDATDGVVAGSGRALVTGEAPPLNLLVEAEREGISVVRYTDGRALRALRRPSSDPVLPSELRLPPLQRRSGAGRWAWRGLETPREGRRVAADAFDSLREQFPTPFVDRVRWLRESLDPLEPAWVIASNHDVRASLAQGDRIAHAFLDLAPAQGRPQTMAPHRAWDAPPHGLSRFVVSTLASAVGVARLPFDQVPGRGLMFLDGDLAVPILLASRAFAVWMRATAGSLNGRYRVQPSILETLPIPDTMELVEVGEDASALVLRAPHDGLLFDERDDVIWRGSTLTLDPRETRISRADELVLAGYGLSPHATDLQVLHRLVTANEAFRK